MTIIRGYIRPAGQPGARNHVLVLPSVICAARVAREVADATGATSLTHQHGCGHIGADISQTRNLFVGLAASPNVAESMVVSLGCETVQGSVVADKLAGMGRNTRFVGIQAAGGYYPARRAGIAEAGDLVRAAQGMTRVAVEQSELTVGLAVSRPDPRIAELVTAITGRGGRVVIAAGADSAPCIGDGTASISIGDEPSAAVSQVQDVSSAGSHLLAALASCRAQVLVEFGASDQPPLGFPLAPVVAVAAGSGLHAAIESEFDVRAEQDARGIVVAIDEAFSGTTTKAERRNPRTLAVPRLMRTM
jgi:altronate dehydratase large subunit